MLYLVAIGLAFAAAFFIHSYFKFRLFNSAKEAIMTIGIPASMTVTLDYIGTYMNFWQYPAETSVGFEILGLPIEAFAFACLGPYIVMTINAWSKQSKRSGRGRRRN